MNHQPFTDIALEASENAARIRELMQEHLNLEPGWFGRPKARHHAILAEIRNLSTRNSTLMKEALLLRSIAEGRFPNPAVSRII